MYSLVIMFFLLHVTPIQKVATFFECFLPHFQFSTMHVPAMKSALHHPIPSGGTPELGVAAEEPAAHVFALICDEFVWVPNTSVPTLFTIPQKYIAISDHRSNATLCRPGKPPKLSL
jgi:hypothetical protein